MKLPYSLEIILVIVWEKKWTEILNSHICTNFTNKLYFPCMPIFEIDSIAKIFTGAFNVACL